jgi:cardiolipin synthase
LTLPNVITLARLLAVPAIIWLILSSEFQPAFWLFVAAGVSDGIDGFIAKQFHMRSELGAFLDPVADKSLLISIYVTLGVMLVVPLWLVIIVVARDVMILGSFVLLGLMGATPEVRPLLISKINTFLQIALAATELLRMGYDRGLAGVDRVLILAVAASTFASGLAYLIQWGRAAESGQAR